MNKDYTNDYPSSQDANQPSPQPHWDDEITETFNWEIQEADFNRFKQEFLPLIWPAGHGFPYFCRFKPRMAAFWPEDYSTVRLAGLYDMWPNSDIYFGVRIKRPKARKRSV